MSLLTDIGRDWEGLEERLAHRKVHPNPNPPSAPVIPSCPVATVRFVNRSRTVSDAEIGTHLPNLQTQVCHDWAPVWLIEAALVAGGTPAAGEYVLYIEDEASIPGALGFHEEVNGVPIGHVFAATSRRAGVSWTSVASHELLEMLGDPRTVLAGIVDPNGDGRSGRIVIAETCDAVEQSIYAISGTEVSDFVFPAWFDATATSGPFDHLGKLSAALELEPGGSYIGFVDFVSEQGWQTQQARKAPGGEPPADPTQEASAS